MSRSNGFGMNHDIPIVGRGLGNVRVGTGLQALVRKLDKHGTYDPERVLQHPNGMQQPIPHRTDYVDAEELVEMIRLVVREELAGRIDGRDTSAQ